MAHNNQNHTKRASFILAVAVNLYAVIATYLYKNFQINLMDYSTLISTPCLSGANCVEVCYS